GLPLAPADNAAAVLQASGWMTGLPPRPGFARGAGEHDPWRFDAVRLVESGEADCAVWISAWSATTPAWKRDMPTVVLARLAGGHVVDPAHGRDGVGDVWISDGRIVAAPQGGKADETHDVAGKMVLAGAIDIHSHIAGHNETMGRLLLPELRQVEHPGHGTPRGAWSTRETGRLYA